MPGARLVNPFNTSQVATVLGDALENEGPNFETFAHMSRFVNENTSLFWAKRFLTRLEHLSGDPHHEAKLLRINEEPVLGLVKNARSPLVFLDYDGTLRSYVINPKEAVPDARIRGGTSAVTCQGTAVAEALPRARTAPGSKVVYGA